MGSRIDRDGEFDVKFATGRAFKPQAVDPLPANSAPHSYVSSVDKRLHFVDDNGVDVPQTTSATAPGFAPVTVLTTSALAANTYAAGVITVTATGAQTVKGRILVLGDTVGVFGESSSVNGIYDVTTAGDVGVQLVLKRRSDASASAAFALGKLIPVSALDTTNGGQTLYVSNATAITLDTTTITVAASIDAAVTLAAVNTALGEPALLTLKVTIANAALKTLNATPVTVIAAPAAGLYVEVVSCLARMIFAVAAFDGVGAAEYLELRYTDASGQIITQNVNPTGFADQAITQQRLLPIGGNAALINPVAAAPIVAHIAGGEWYAAAGGGSLKLEILYRVRTLAI